MPRIVNNFVNKVLQLVREFFQAQHYEYGVLNLSPFDNGKTIFVRTSGDVLKVWFSLTPQTDSPDLYVPPPGSKCFITEAQPAPGGFVFQVNLSDHCRVSWFAIEEL